MSGSILTLLLVENFAPDREQYRRYLLSDTSSSYQVLEADTALAGLALCQTQAIDAILLNYSLPDQNGLAFLESLQAQMNEKSPPVVMVAGQGDESIAVRAIKLGAEDYLSKRQLTATLLCSTMRTAIENARLRLQLQESRDLFQVSVENMLDCFGIYSAIRNNSGQIVDFRIDYMNASALAANRMTAGDLGKSLCELLPAHRQTGLFEDYCRLVETGEPLSKESLVYSDLYNQQFLTRAFEIRASKLGDGFVASWRDITDRKQTELALVESNNRLRDSETQLLVGVQVAGVALARFDYASNTVELSPEAAALYGLPVEQLTVSRDRVHATFHPDERDLMEQIIARVLDPAGDGWFSRDHRVVWQTGEVRWLKVRKQVFFERAGGSMRPSYAILAAIDITDTKRAEAEREQLLAQAQASRQEAEAANRSKDEFVALVAHELRSPLNSILGWAILLRTRQFDAATTAKALETIERNTRAQVQLVEDLLDVSRMASGKLHLTLAPVNVATVIEAAIDLVQPQVRAKQIRLNARLRIAPQISGDCNRLQQIVVNLLANAIKFTPEQGQIDIELTQVDTQVQLQVSDSGKGIAPEFLPRIFERFQQGQKNTGSKDGLGLGLAIVKNLVELHQGTISAESPGIGQGATFTVRFPMLSLPAIAPSPAEPNFNATSLAGIRVLAVDDEPDMLDLIAFVLEQYGAEVRSTASAAAAMALLREFKPDILLTDIAMPEATGYDLVQEIRRFEAAQSGSLTSANPIPAIALTAYASATYEERSLQAGFQRHLTKPVEPAVLVVAILELLKR